MDRENRLRKLESVMANQQIWDSAPSYSTVERRGSVSRDEFLECYVRDGRPLVLTDVAKDWLAIVR